MTKQERDIVIDAFKSEVATRAKVDAATEILSKALPDNGEPHAIPGTPFLASRRGDSITIKAAPQTSIDDLLT